MTEFSTGNLERDRMIRNVIGKLSRRSQPINLGNMAKRLPPDFSLGQDEIDAFTTVEFEGVPLTRADEEEEAVPRDPYSGNALAAKSEPVGSSPVRYSEEPATLVTPENANKAITHADAIAALAKAQETIHIRRGAVRVATERVRAARYALHLAVQTFEQAGDTRTPAERQLAASRQYAEQSQRDRAALKAAGFNPQSQRTKNFVMKQMVNGPKRGALSEAGRARYGFVVPGSAAAAAPGWATDRTG
jgi:hypothetical protein